MSPVNAAVCVHQVAPVILEDNKGDISKHKGTVLEQQTSKSFLTVKSACAPCITRGSSPYWRSLENHNRAAEPYIGKMSDVIKHQ